MNIYLSKRRGGNVSSSTYILERCRTSGYTILWGIVNYAWNVKIGIDVFVDSQSVSQSALLFVGSLNDACLSSLQQCKATVFSFSWRLINGYVVPLMWIYYTISCCYLSQWNCWQTCKGGITTYYYYIFQWIQRLYWASKELIWGISASQSEKTMGTRKNIVQILDSGSESMRHTHYVTLYLINVCCVWCRSSTRVDSWVTTMQLRLGYSKYCCWQYITAAEDGIPTTMQAL